MPLTSAEREKLEEKLAKARGIAGELGMYPVIAEVYPDKDLVTESVIAALSIPTLEALKKDRDSAKAESSLTLKSLYLINNYVSRWAQRWDEGTMRQKLQGYDIKDIKAGSTDDLINSLKDRLSKDMKGNTFWDKSLKIGVAICAVAAVATAVIFTTGVGAPVAAFLTAQFTAWPTVATAIAAGGIILATSAGVWLDGKIRDIFGKIKGKIKPKSPVQAQLDKSGATVEREPEQTSQDARKSKVISSEVGAEQASTPREPAATPAKALEDDQPKKGSKLRASLRERAESQGTVLRKSGAREVSQSQRPTRSQHRAQKRSQRRAQKRRETARSA